MFLSILAICGGFLAPVLISTGSRNFTGLFIYMIVLALGATSVARFRNWPILNILSFILVWAIYILAEPFKVTFDYPYSLALLFATIFFLIFTLQNSFFNTWLKRKSTLIEVGLEFLNCIIFTSVSLGNYPSLYWVKELAAFIPFGVAIILFGQLFLLKYKNVEDKAFKLTIMVLICCFLTLSIPLALAAKYVSEHDDETIAAIASSDTAELYDLCVLKSNINASNINTTRFGAFCRTMHNEKKNNPNDERSILLFTVKNEAGALAKTLNIIGSHGFNMISLRSRPMKELIWNYYFYVEIEGDITGEEGQNMIKALSIFCDKLKIVARYNL
jgi:hypothetical protein